MTQPLIHRQKLILSLVPIGATLNLYSTLQVRNHLSPNILTKLRKNFGFLILPPNSKVHSCFIFFVSSRLFSPVTLYLHSTNSSLSCCRNLFPYVVLNIHPTNTFLLLTLEYPPFSYCPLFHGYQASVKQYILLPICPSTRFSVAPSDKKSSLFSPPNIKASHHPRTFLVSLPHRPLLTTPHSPWLHRHSLTSSSSPSSVFFYVSTFVGLFVGLFLTLQTLSP